MLSLAASGNSALNLSFVVDKAIATSDLLFMVMIVLSITLPCNNPQLGGAAEKKGLCNSSARLISEYLLTWRAYFS